MTKRHKTPVSPALLTLGSILLLLCSLSASAATFTVTSTSDSGPGSLRQALLSATTGDRIEFAIGNGHRVIQPLTPLPTANQVTIDGRTQPGYVDKPLIELDGSLVSGGAFVTLLTANRGAIYGLVVNRSPGIGIATFQTTVEYCFIGTDHTGTIARPNRAGLEGSGVIRANLISANTAYNVSPRGNTNLSGNHIGTRFGGKQLLGSTGTGVYVNGTVFTGPVLIQSNVIGGARDYGIEIYYNQNVTINGNRIGVAATGEPLPNRFGIHIYQSSNNAVSGNVIAHNTDTAVLVDGSSLRNGIVANSIRDNGGRGIDLAQSYPYDGPTPNDADDGDIGPNNFVNYPVLERVTSVDGTTTIAGALHSNPNRTFTIQLFRSASCDASGYGEGAEMLESFSATTNGNGDFEFSRTLARSIPGGEVITATASSNEEGTSEFSRCAMVQGRGSFAFATATLVRPEWDNVVVAVRREGGAVGAATVSYTTASGTAVSGQDFVPASGTLTFADGETEQFVVVDLTDDNRFEGSQSFTINLSNSTGGATLGAPAQVQVTITDNDGPPNPTVTGTTKNEGDSGTTPFQWTFTLPEPQDAVVEITWQAGSGSAMSQSDFIADGGMLVFAPGEVQKSVTVLVKGDTVYEGDEQFYVSWYASHWRSTASVILNDDPARAVTVEDVTVVETDGTSNVEVTLTANMPLHGPVSWATQPGTAIAGSDYTQRTGMVYFSYETTKTITIPILGDVEPENTEQFTVTFVQHWGDFEVDPSVTITINDDDLGIGPARLELALGQTDEGMIRVGTPAATHTLFLLQSSAPDVATVPQSVTLPAGSREVTFPIQAHTTIGGANVDVTIPAEFGGGSARIRVETYTPAQLTLTPADLTLVRDQSLTVHATLEPANTTAVTVRLSATDTVAVPETFEIAPGGSGSFEVRGVTAGRFMITATLPPAYGNAPSSIGGRVIEPPTTPTILNVSPADGSVAGGTTVEITGALFRRDCVVRFGGVPSTDTTFVDMQTLRTVAPPHDAGLVDVTLNCGSDVATLPNAFLYRAAGPYVANVAPASGQTSGGTYVRISGRDLAPSCWPFFGDAASPLAMVRDDETIDAVTPPHTPGAKDVRLLCTGTQALLAGGFTYVTTPDAAPQIASIDPLFGAPGDVVTITGTGFGPADKVLFGQAAARLLDATPTTITVAVPDLPPGKVVVSIERQAVTATAAGPMFTIGESSPPRVARVTPSAAAGAEIVLEGSGLRPSYSFAIDGKPLAIASLSPTRATVRLPNDLAAGTYPIEIVNAAGQTAALAPAVSVRANGVVVMNVNGRCAATDGGIDVVIEGRGFASGAIVTFDDIPATNVVLIDETKLQVRVPANYAGAAVVAVTNSDGSSSTLTGAFRYSSPFDPNGCSSGRARSVRH